MKPHLLLLAALLLLSLPVKAQEEEPWTELYQQLITSDEADDGSYADTYELLSELYHHPISLNTATANDLEQLPFLSETQIENLLEYVYRYGPVRSLSELSMVPGFERREWELLSFFVTVEDASKKNRFPSLGEIARYGKQELTAYGDIPFYNRAGDLKGYLGNKYRHWLRYTFQDGQWVKFGITGSQDAGEPFFTNGNGQGYDYYSFFLQLGKLGAVKKLVLGRYRLRAGMGLVINTDMSFGKLSMLQSLSRHGVYMRGQSSRSDNYLQGAAATIELTKGLNLSLFASTRKVDGTLSGDSTVITNISTSGYHRTRHEMDRKHNTRMSLVGGDLSWRLGRFHLGATAAYTVLNRELQPLTSQKYRRYYPSGSRFWNASLSYGYISGRLMLNGETATGSSKALATVNALSLKLGSDLQLMAVQRFYSYKYYALLGRSFSDGGRVQNESGLYVGANWRPVRGLTLMAYGDYAYFSWPRYLCSDASHSWEALASAIYLKHGWTFSARYRVKLRQRDNEDKDALTDIVTHRLRLQAGRKTDRWQLRTQADLSLCSREAGSSFGWMISQQGGWSMLSWLRLSGSVGYFHTQDYDSRVYSSEPNMLYSFRFPMFFGQGLRYTFLCTVQPLQRLKLIARLGSTHYFDRESIGSDLQEIDGSSQTDLELQLQWKF